MADRLADLFKIVMAAMCPHTDCEHANTYACSGWAYAEDALAAIPDGWVKLDGRWLQVAQADRYDVEGPSGVIDGSQVLVTLPERTES